MTKLTNEQIEQILEDLTPHPLARNELIEAGVLTAMSEAKEAILSLRQEVERLREELVIQTKRGDIASGAIDTALELKGKDHE